MTASARRGYDLFIAQANCVLCHAGGPLSNATIPVLNIDIAALGIEIATEIMPMRDLLPSAYDVGYYNVGIRPTAEDIGIGANDPFGNPLSFARSLQLGILRDPNRPAGQIITGTTRLAINGAFKVPGLRNVALNAPYNHTGGYSTLHQTINLYNRGFDHDNGVNLSPDVAVNRQLSVAQKQDLVQLMLEMTDPRVENRSAPFDHPELRIPNGHPNAAGSTSRVVNRGDGNATDTMLTIPASGRSGGPKLRRFLGFTETRINTF
jgi:cytochrome c peroxidase